MKRVRTVESADARPPAPCPTGPLPALSHPKHEHRAAAVSAFDDDEPPEMMHAAADLCLTNGALVWVWQNLR
jgi:hypothetical protein